MCINHTFALLKIFSINLPPPLPHHMFTYVWWIEDYFGKHNGSFAHHNQVIFSKGILEILKYVSLMEFTLHMLLYTIYLWLFRSGIKTTFNLVELNPHFCKSNSNLIKRAKPDFTEWHYIQSYVYNFSCFRTFWRYLENGSWVSVMSGYYMSFTCVMV